MPRFSYLAPALICGLLASTLALSCDNGSGLLARVQEEKKAQTSGPFTRASVGDLVALNGIVFARRGPGILKAPDWSEVTGLPDPYTCASLASTGTTLYAAVKSSTAPGLYQTSDGTNWTKAVASADIESVFAPTGAVYFSEHHQGLLGEGSDTWELFFWNGASAATVPTNNLTVNAEAGTPVVGVATFSGYAGFVAVRRSGVYTSTTAAGPFTLLASGLPTDLTSLAAGPADLYFGSASGKVWTWNGGAWPTTSVTVFPGAPIKALAVLPATASSSILAAGLQGTTTGATGYYELSLASPDSPGAAILGSLGGAVLANGSATNYETTLRDLPVNAFLYVPDASIPTAGTLYAGTTASGNSTASGLHTDAWSGSAWGSWIAK